MTRNQKRQPTFIARDRLYTLRDFQESSGISPTRIREGKLQGVEPRWIQVGKRKFIHGDDAIDLIERLAEL